MAFSDVYASILLPFVKNYSAAKNDKERKAVVNHAAEAVTNSKNLMEQDGFHLPKDLKTVCILF
jgi:hypothetical protein